MTFKLQGLRWRDWQMLAAGAIYFAANVYLWSLPISNLLLLLITAPMGLAVYAALFWYVMRE